MSLSIPDLQAIRRTVVAVADWVLPPCSIVLAGGAPRDIFHRRPVRDIDLFITPSDTVDSDDWFAFVQETARACKLPLGICSQRADFNRRREAWVPISWGPANHAKDDYCGSSYILLSVAEVHLHPHPLNLILTLNPDPVADFDNRLSQCWIDDRGFRAVPGFHADSAARIVRWLKPSTIKRLDKLSAKYPCWRQTNFRERGEQYPGQSAAPTRQDEAAFLWDSSAPTYSSLKDVPF